MGKRGVAEKDFLGVIFVGGVILSILALEYLAQKVFICRSYIFSP